LFPALLPFFKYILDVVFCEVVQNQLQFCLSPHLCQNGGEAEKSRVGGGTSSHVLAKKFPDEKENVRLCCRDTTASSFAAKGRGEVFAHFHAINVKLHGCILN
jgi:hypothetical protein